MPVFDKTLLTAVDTVDPGAIDSSPQLFSDFAVERSALLVGHKQGGTKAGDVETNAALCCALGEPEHCLQEYTGFSAI